MNRELVELGLPGWQLRRWREADAPALQLLADDERIARWMVDTWPMPYTLDDARWWVTEGHQAGGASTWAICLNDAPQGGCGFHPGQGPLRCNAEVGWWLAPTFWGLGVASRAAREVVAQALAHPEITRVFAGIYDGNAPSQRVAEKIGMQYEGLQRQSVIKQGRVLDRHLYACYRA